MPMGVGCPVDAPPGPPFAFRLTNGSDVPIRLFLGCGKNPPITLHTATGDRGIGPESGSFCGKTCDDVFSSGVPSVCTDCGPGYLLTIDVAATKEITWDRRLWDHGTIEPNCSETLKGECAKGVAVGASEITGTVKYCLESDPAPPCDTKQQEFTTSLDAGSIALVLP
jgi:hypothetical protein